MLQEIEKLFCQMGQLFALFEFKTRNMCDLDTSISREVGTKENLTEVQKIIFNSSKFSKYFPKNSEPRKLMENSRKIRNKIIHSHFEDAIIIIKTWKGEDFLTGSRSVHFNLKNSQVQFTDQSSQEKIGVYGYYLEAFNTGTFFAVIRILNNAVALLNIIIHMDNYQKVALQGVEQYQYSLGMFFLEGTSNIEEIYLPLIFKKDDIKAHAWLSLSAEQGFEAAKKVLSGLSNKISSKEKKQVHQEIEKIKEQIEEYKNSDEFKKMQESTKRFTKNYLS